MKQPTGLYRAHSKKYLASPIGMIENPNWERDRRPRDMPIQFHAALASWFLARFGVDYRGKALFCSGDISVAVGYRTAISEVVELTPQPPYSICYSEKCKDLYGHYLFRWSARNFAEINLEEELESLEFQHVVNEGLERAAATGHEVMLFSQYCTYKIV